MTRVLQKRHLPDQPIEYLVVVRCSDFKKLRERWVPIRELQQFNHGNELIKVFEQSKVGQHGVDAYLPKRRSLGLRVDTSGSQPVVSISPLGEISSRVAAFKSKSQASPASAHCVSPQTHARKNRADTGQVKTNPSARGNSKSERTATVVIGNDVAKTCDNIDSSYDSSDSDDDVLYSLADATSDTNTKQSSLPHGNVKRKADDDPDVSIRSAKRPAKKLTSASRYGGIAHVNAALLKQSSSSRNADESVTNETSTSTEHADPEIQFKIPTSPPPAAPPSVVPLRSTKPGSLS